MENSYSYPLDIDWSTEEIIIVVEFFQMIEEGYESGIKSSTLMEGYRNFKTVVPSKAEEKTLFREFKEVSGFESYNLIKQLKDSHTNEILKISK